VRACKPQSDHIQFVLLEQNVHSAQSARLRAKLSAVIQIEKTYPMPKFVKSLIAIAITAIFSTAAIAQIGSTDDQIDPAQKNPMRIRGAANKPCVTLKGRIVQDKVNTTIVNHYLRAANACPKMIKIKACYAHSARCVEFTLRSLEQKEVLLGITNTSMPVLNFDFTEKQVM